MDLLDLNRPDPMKLGYNTNGLAHHRLLDAIDFLAEQGYESVAITLDAAALDPYQPADRLRDEVRAVRDALDRRGLGRVVETGARYILNPRRKHDPNLMDPDPARRSIRQDFLRHSIDIAADLGADAISFWSGATREEIGEDEALGRLANGIRSLLPHAEARGIILAFEPEPGMFLDTFDRFARLDERIGHDLFHLTVDVGHVHCIEDGPAEDHIARWGSRIRNVHIEDMARGVHEHLMFGEGTMDFPPILRALRDAGYSGGLHVELSRHSHMGPEAVQRAADFLRPLLASR